MSGLWVGADPGGKDSFGLAFLDISGEAECSTLSSVDEVVARIACKGRPLGMGIDAPMWWSTCEGGWRKADKRIREKHPDALSSVLSVNSLRGAALIGGVMLAVRIREKFPDTRMTESHPKAVLKALGLDGPKFFECCGVRAKWKKEHERDALIAAVCAREGFEERWTTSLALDRFDSEQDPQEYWLAPMHYFWPPRL